MVILSNQSGTQVLVNVRFTDIEENLYYLFRYLYKHEVIFKGSDLLKLSDTFNISKDDMVNREISRLYNQNLIELHFVEDADENPKLALNSFIFNEEFNLNMNENHLIVNQDNSEFKGRYHSFIIRFINKKYEIDIELIRQIIESVFDRYKMGLLDSPESLYIISYSSIRKRINTVEKEINNAFKLFVSNKLLSEEVACTYDMFLTKNTVLFDRSVPQGEFIVGDGSELSYYGRDVITLDSKNQRFEWQNELLMKIIDLEQKEFLEPNDRTIIWISDAKGCTGKSKFVKWMCITFAEQVAKITFGTTGQLVSSLISAGVRKCYFLDIPRTKGKEDSLESMISCIEDLKNGHIVSNFYGRYKQLMMDPPHVIVFSNDKCPRHMMSEDRWLT